MTEVTPPTPQPTFGAIPKSEALAEATVDSLTELMSRDPEGYSSQDLDKIVAAMRAQRERLATVQAEAPAKRPRAIGAPVTLKSTVSADDMGL